MGITAENVPPLPDLGELLEQSDVIGAVPGLRDHGRLWLARGPRARAASLAEGIALAQPSFGPSTMKALGSTGVDLARGVRSGVREVERRRSTSGSRSTKSGLPAARQALREVVEAGGPTYVKLGQFIATAQGLLPDVWVDMFGWCRDTAAPLRPGVAQRVIESRIDAPLRAAFAEFDTEPLGAASIGQVHAATLHDGTEVVVKVRRPGLRSRFVRDLRTLAAAAAVAERTSKAARTANLLGFVELFGQLALEECDFRFEALNQIELAVASEAASQSDAVMPLPVPHLTHEDVFAMTRVEGVPYDRAVERFPDVIEGERLLRLAVTTVVEHMVVFGRFHGDLHAGNVLINEQGNLGIIDFGIVGRIDPMQRAATVQLLFGFARNDSLMQAKALQAFGAIPADADLPRLVEQMEAEVNAIDPTLLARDAELTVDQLGSALGAIIRVLAGNGFRLPKELILFFKNLLYLNGFAQALAPDMNLLNEIEPIFGYFLQRYPTELTQIMAVVEPD